MALDKVLETGEAVLVGDDIQGTVEEVIWCRGMAWPFYLVEWWQDGDLRSRRFHAKDVHRMEPTRET